LFWHFPHCTNQGSRPGGAVRQGDWKFIEHYDTAAPELYNLAADPGETTNRAAREPERVSGLRDQLAVWIAQVDAQTNAPNPNFQPALWKQLYQDIDVSRHVPTKASPVEHDRMLAWRKQMDVVLIKDRKSE
jgi:hypothetical protein